MSDQSSPPVDVERWAAMCEAQAATWHGRWAAAHSGLDAKLADECEAERDDWRAMADRLRALSSTPAGRAIKGWARANPRAGEFAQPAYELWTKEPIGVTCRAVLILLPEEPSR